MKQRILGYQNKIETMFTGNVLCVYCRCQISFSGNNISYQNQRCANHNREHQFPGMHITIEEINNNISNLKNHRNFYGKNNIKYLEIGNAC